MKQLHSEIVRAEQQHLRATDGESMRPMPEDICAAILADGGSPEASLWKEIISDGPGNFDNVRYLLCGPLGIVQFVIAFNAIDNKIGRAHV